MKDAAAKLEGISEEKTTEARVVEFSKQLRGNLGKWWG